MINNIRNNTDIYNLLYYLITNASKEFSLNTLSKITQLSVDTVKEYIEYATFSYLLFIVNKYDYSLKKQLVNPKKIYCIDTGLANSISFKFSEDKGRLLENLVFIELKRRGKEIFYHKGKKECDFVIREGLDIVEAIQVTTSLEDYETRKREISGLKDALKTYNLKEGLILTEDEEEVIEEDGFKIMVKPIWKFMLS